MHIVITFSEQLNFETTLVTKLDSYLEQQERLKDIVKEEDKLIYGGKEAGKLGLAVCAVHVYLSMYVHIYIFRNQLM